MKKFVAFSLLTVMVCSLFLFTGLPVYADTNPDGETVDWDSVDWETFKVTDYSNEQINTLYDWIYGNADLDILAALISKVDGGLAESVCSRLETLFLNDPVNFIRGLAKYDMQTQINVVNHFIYTMEYHMTPQELATFITGLEFSESEPPGVYDAWAVVIACAEEYYGIEIDNPKTADPVGVFAALLALSAAGVGVLLTRKKEF